jgi:hypothetical protein
MMKRHVMAAQSGLEHRHLVMVDVHSALLRNRLANPDH